MNDGIGARAQAAAELGRFDEVERLARQGLADAPDDEVLLALLGEAVAERAIGPEQRAEAAELVRRAVGAAPSDGWVRRSASVTCAGLGLWQEGLEHAEAAVALEPNNAYGHIVLTERLIRAASEQRWASEQHLVRAAQHAEVAIGLAPDDGVAYLVAGRVRFAMGDPMAARYFVDIGMRMDPDHPLGHQLLGALAMGAGDVRSASEHYVTAGRLDPTSPTNVEVLRSVGRLRPFAVMVGCYFAFAGLRSAFRAETVFDAVAMVAFAVAIVVWMLWPKLRARRGLSAEAKQVLELDRRTNRTRRWPWSRSGVRARSRPGGRG